VKRSAPNWAVLHEYAHEPLQFYWIRAAVRFYNGLLSSNSATLKQALHADLKLVPWAKTSWASDILRAFEGLRGCDTYSQALLITMTYHSWFACPLLDLQADSRTRVRNGCAPLMPPRYLHLDLPMHVMRNVSRFRLRALLRWNPPSGTVEMATVTSVPLLLFKMRYMFFFTVKTCLCALSEKSTRSFSSLSANPFLWRPLLFYMSSRPLLFNMPSRPLLFNMPLRQVA